MPSPKPLAVFYGPTSGKVGDLLAYHASTSNQVSYLWDFGDGTKSELQFPAHRYAKEGTYVVSLIVTVNGTPSDPLRKSITVFSTFSVSTDPTLSGSVGNAVNFSATTSGGVLPLTYSWTFGDGGTSTSLNTTHPYSSPGTYNASLTVTDASNNVITKPVTVSIGKVSQTISYTTPSSPLQVDDTVTLAATASSGLTVAFSIDPASTGTGNIVGSVLTATGAGNVIVDYNQAGNSTYAAAPQVQQSITVTDTPVTSEPLMYQDNFTYLGAFRVPNTGFSYGGTCLAYNSVNNSLFIVGENQNVAEINIPTPVISNNLTSLNTCTVRQSPTNIISRFPSNPSGANVIGGLLPYGGKLYGSAYVFYDGAGTAVKSHFILNSLNLSSAAVTGLFQVGNLGAGLVAGYMCTVPAEWQSDLGYPCITGQSNLSIISRTSSGPASFGYDPTTLGPTTAPFQPYLYYSVGSPLGPYETSLSDPANPLQNGCTQQPGILFPPGTSSVLFCGLTATNWSGYGEAGSWSDFSSGSKGPHSLLGKYTFCFWAYDVNDFIAVKNGTKTHGQLTPYNVWSFQLPIVGTTAGLAHTLGGMAFDPLAKRVYISVLNLDNVVSFSSLPVIYVFQLDSTTQFDPPVRVGSLCAYPTITPSGPIDHPENVGTSVTIHQGNNIKMVAGNCYAKVGLSISKVSFFLDGTKIGEGTSVATPFASHNYQLSYSTSGISIGSHVLSCVATGSDSTDSAPVTFTLTIVA